MIRKLIRRFALGAATLAMLLATTSQARADLDFSFEIDNTIGTVSGSVFGRILGLTDNATSSASQVLIDSFPAGLNSIAGSTPINAMLWDQQLQNSFTVSAGQVVGGGFWSQQTISGFPQGFQLYINGGAGPFNFLNIDGQDQLYVWGDDGLAASHIAPLRSVPEPSSMALLGLGIAGAAFVARHRNRQVA
jgi:PEP-CTERM motif